MYRALVVFLVFSLAGCSHYRSSEKSIIKALKDGDFIQAEEKIVQVSQKKIPDDKYTSCHDAVLMLLDRSMIHLLNGKLDESIRCFSLSLDAIDYYQQSSLADKLGKFTLEDSTEAYVGPFYEHNLARFYLSLALIQKGDLSNARALLLQIENQNDLQKEMGGGFDNSAAKYLLAFLLYREGDVSNAKLLFKEVEQDPTKAKLIFLLHNGRAPTKKSTLAPASIISLAMLEQLLSIYNIKPAISSLSGIPVPKLINHSPPSPLDISLASKKIQLRPEVDIQRLAQMQLEKDLPAIATRSAARLLLRRAAVGIAQQKNDLLGFLLDLINLGFNLSTRADTRTWAILPAEIYMRQMDVDAGDYAFNVGAKQYAVHTKPGDLCIINVFNLYSKQTVLISGEKE